MISKNGLCVAAAQLTDGLEGKVRINVDDTEIYNTLRI